MQKELFNTESQEKQILQSLKKGEKLTPYEMLFRYGCLRASARIFDLRKKGHPIKMKMVRKNNARVAEYYM